MKKIYVKIWNIHWMFVFMILGYCWYIYSNPSCHWMHWQCFKI